MAAWKTNDARKIGPKALKNEQPSSLAPLGAALHTARGSRSTLTVLLHAGSCVSYSAAEQQRSVKYKSGEHTAGERECEQESWEQQQSGLVQWCRAGQRALPHQSKAGSFLPEAAQRAAAAAAGPCKRGRRRQPQQGSLATGAPAAAQGGTAIGHKPK